MDLVTEFNESEVISLVEKVLSGEIEVAPAARSILPYGQGQLFEVLFAQLNKLLHPSDLQMLLDSLRDELTSGLDFGDLKSIHSLTQVCKKCPSAESKAELPKWNRADPDALIVLESPNITKDAVDILMNGLSTAGFSSTRTCLSYVNRCKSSGEYSPEEIGTCFPYLTSEINLLRPKLIVPLGLKTTIALLGSGIKLGNCRGTITWIGPWAIMPTYSPTHVLTAGKNFEKQFHQDLTNAHHFLYG